MASTPATSAAVRRLGRFPRPRRASRPLQPGLDGDTVAVEAFSSIGPFEQYGQQFTNLAVSEDGIVTVAGGYGGEPWVPQAIPDPDLPNGVIAPLWSDLETVGGRRPRHPAGPDRLLGVAVIQWENLFEFTDRRHASARRSARSRRGSTTRVEDFRPEMTFEYPDLGALPAIATIGIEDILGEQRDCRARRRRSEHRR